MADWNLLPQELLGKISGHLKTSIDLLRFRSVCSSWRSAVPPNASAPSSISLPIPCHGVDPAIPGRLSKFTVFLISPLHSTTPRSWLVKINSADASSKHLLCPLSRYRFNPSFPRPLDLFNFRISELGHEYHLRANLESTHPPPSLVKIWIPRRVAITWLDGGSHFLLLIIIDVGDLAMYKSVDRQWTLIPEESYHLYRDVIAYNENMYAVDNTGRTVHVGPNAELDLIANANPLLEGLDKYLVDSKGQLLLVNLYANKDYGCNELWENQTTNESARVFKLDDKSQSWIEVNCLDDQVLFLGEDSSFSASDADLSGCCSNCIFFSDSYGYVKNSKEDAGVLLGKTIGVFELGSDSAGLLRSYPEHAKMFWPPPDWVSSALIEEPTQNQSEGSSLIHDDSALEQH